METQRWKVIHAQKRGSDTDPTYKEWKHLDDNYLDIERRNTDPTYKEWKRLMEEAINEE